MKEIARLKGIPIPESYLESATSFNRNRKTTCVDDEDFILWSKGINHLSVVDPDIFEEVEELSNFWLHSNSWCFGLCAAGTRDMQKIVGIGYGNNQNYTLHTCMRSREAKLNSYNVSEFLDSKKFLYNFFSEKTKLFGIFFLQKLLLCCRRRWLQ